MPSAPNAPDASATLNEPLLSVEAESCMPQAISVVAADNRPPDDGPVVQQSLSVSCEAKWPPSTLLVATLILGEASSFWWASVPVRRSSTGSFPHLLVLCSMASQSGGAR